MSKRCSSEFDVRGLMRHDKITRVDQLLDATLSLARLTGKDEVRLYPSATQHHAGLESWNRSDGKTG